MERRGAVIGSLLVALVIILFFSVNGISGDGEEKVAGEKKTIKFKGRFVDKNTCVHAPGKSEAERVTPEPEECNPIESLHLIVMAPLHGDSVLAEIIGGANGYYEVEVPYQPKITLVADAKCYYFAVEMFTIPDSFNGTIERNFFLPPSCCPALPSPVYFQKGSSSWNLSERDKLIAARRYLDSAPGEILRIRGCSESQVTRKRELRLSRERAERVRRYLIDELLVPPSRVFGEGCGRCNTREMYSTDPDESKLVPMPDSRVEFEPVEAWRPDAPDPRDICPKDGNGGK